MSIFVEEMECPVCKKTFVRRENWAYKRNNHLFCTWGCLRKYDKKSRESRVNARRLDRSERSEIVELLSKGVSPQRIADKVGVSVQAIIYYKQKAGA